jgi:SAM-dependent methyltransferase
VGDHAALTEAPRGSTKGLRAYFGRPRLLNALLSRGLFLVLRARLTGQRTWNRVRARDRAPALPGGSAQVRLETFLAAGYSKLNLGGGAKSLEGFVNLDFVGHPEVLREVVADLQDLAFLPSDRMTHVHSNHVFEHLDEPVLARLLTEVHRVLVPGGLLTVRCPNALGVCFGFFFGEVLEADREGFLAAGFPADEDFADPRDRWYRGDLFALLHWLYGCAGRADNQHLQRLTPTSLRRLVEASGLEILKVSDPEASNLVLVARRPRHA